ncbi:putative glucosamine-phosphate N-acetyltransferase transcription regulator GNAT family [Lupinus albus]|uniref:Glucosamine 6-phosphate N-acetyltransferase n=1 Tax=Lupinus albus TaxID=3870 RepID=A0A6A4R9U1_LUPAL|nr:putative glucosamine-phosphate N-acetyltransferase transcription regulator GNAT family [Lupinus albus]
MEKMKHTENEEQKFTVRKLEISDKGKGFIELLQQLSVCDSVSNDEFECRFQELSSLGEDHVICVIEDEVSGKIVATGSVFIEKKFLRNCGKVGHIEDVVVDSSIRGKQLGKKIINFLTDHARSIGCYKVILDCSLDNKVFYEKCGFKQKEVQMFTRVSLDAMLGLLLSDQEVTGSNPKNNLSTRWVRLHTSTLKSLLHLTNFLLVFVVSE